MVLSTFFPPRETFIERAVRPDEVYEREEHEGIGGAAVIEGKGGDEEDGNGEMVKREKGDWKGLDDGVRGI